MKKEDNKVKCADDKREWRPLSSYRGGHALFRIINKNTEFGEFIISGSIALNTEMLMKYGLI